MKAYLIDPGARRITEVAASRWTLDAIYRTLGCDTVDGVGLHNGDHAYVDDEGLLKVGLSRFGFRDQKNLRGQQVVLAGKALVLGETDDGRECSSAYTLDELIDSVIWVDGKTNGEAPAFTLVAHPTIFD